MIIIIMIAIFVMAMISIQFRIAITHPVETIYYGITDTVNYFRYKEYDRYDGGVLNCYDAHFGGGKTLSVTHFIRLLYHRYHNKKVYDRSRKKWVTQKILILTNVQLKGVYHEMLSSLSQIVMCAWKNKKIDEENDTRTCVLVLLDEASSELNSRNFKSNIDANFLNTLICSRHFHISFYYTSQKFRLVDALLRSVTQKVVWCDKHWRFMVQHEFDADEMEYASNPMLVQPIRRMGFFITNDDYNAYDTLATVERLDKDTREGNMLSEAEILALRGNFYGDNEQIINPSRRLKRIRKTG